MDCIDSKKKQLERKQIFTIHLQEGDEKIYRLHKIKKRGALVCDPL